MTSQNATTDRPTVRAGVIGAGRRCAALFAAVPEDVDVEVVAVADPSEKNRAAFIERFATTTEPKQYTDGLELLAREELDAVVVAGPNFQHTAYASEAMRRSLDLLLEKPVATTVDDLALLWQAQQEGGTAHTAVGFVLRYTPFYTAIREVIQSGRLGEILAIEANENLGTGLTMMQYLGWRQDVAKSGGWMVEKCCHDLDILSHLLDSRPTTVFSMASAKHLRPRPANEQLARFQADAGTAQLDFGDAETHAAFADDAEANAAFADNAQHSPYDTSGLPDRQVATLEFENGVLATFTAVMAQPATTRRIRIFGTGGYLEGDISTASITVTITDPEGGAKPAAVEKIDIATGGSGHHGGDEVLGDTFWHLAAGGEQTSRAGLSDGIDAVLTAIALQESAATGQPVDLTVLRERVFGSDS
ncbi:Gfo/Idh/MocA family protein [Propionibacteriaceae bacterium Y1685]